jgi:lipoprotein-releasing system permease protein
MMQVEKLMSFLILLFIVIIAAFNIIGSLSMLIFEKKESIGVLRSMGAERGLVTRIFLYEGWLVSVGGALLGLVLGVLMVLAQEKWGIVGFGSGEDYIVSSYPVELMWSDVVLTFVSVIVLAVVAAYYPVRVIVRKYYEGRDS